MKCVVIDRRVAYCGSMNLTRSARTNREVMMKFRGPPVLNLLAMLQDVMAAAEQM